MTAIKQPHIKLGFKLWTFCQFHYSSEVCITGYSVVGLGNNYCHQFRVEIKRVAAVFIYHLCRLCEKSPFSSTMKSGQIEALPFDLGLWQPILVLMPTNDQLQVSIYRYCQWQVLSFPVRRTNSWYMKHFYALLFDTITLTPNKQQQQRKTHFY